MARGFLYEKPLPVGKSDTYTLSPPVGWVGDGAITSATVTANGLNIDSQSFNDTTVSVSLTATARARNSVHFEFTVDGEKSDCITGYIDSPEC